MIVDDFDVVRLAVHPAEASTSVASAMSSANSARFPFASAAGSAAAEPRMILPAEHQRTDRDSLVNRSDPSRAPRIGVEKRFHARVLRMEVEETRHAAADEFVQRCIGRHQPEARWRIRK